MEIPALFHCQDSAEKRISIDYSFIIIDGYVSECYDLAIKIEKNVFEAFHTTFAEVNEVSIKLGQLIQNLLVDTLY